MGRLPRHGVVAIVPGVAGLDGFGVIAARMDRGGRHLPDGARMRNRRGDQSQHENELHKGTKQPHRRRCNATSPSSQPGDGRARLTAYDPEFECQMEAARSVMKKRRNLLRELAK